jgi:hypothetical protein
MKLSNQAVARLANNPLVQGAVTGFCGSQALDRIGTYLYDHEATRTRKAEDQARGNRHVYEVAVSQLAGLFGKKLTRRQEQEYGWRFHQVFGLATGFAYVGARKRSRQVGVARGLLFGAAFFLLVDELMMPLLRWSPGPLRFNWKVHARGAVSHIAYGVAAESAYRALEAASG